jgi:hypothetical protein
MLCFYNEKLAKLLFLALEFFKEFGQVSLDKNCLHLLSSLDWGLGGPLSFLLQWIGDKSLAFLRIKPNSLVVEHI